MWGQTQGGWGGGAPSTQPATAFGGFGATTAPAFGASQGGAAFGALGATPAFGAPAQPFGATGTGGMFGATAFSAAGFSAPSAFASSGTQLQLSAASLTAQPGSFSWMQLPKRQCSESLFISGK